MLLKTYKYIGHWKSEDLNDDIVYSNIKTAIQTKLYDSE